MTTKVLTPTHFVFYPLPYLHKHHDSNNTVTHTEDPPQHTNRLRVPHEPGGVHVVALHVVHGALHDVWTILTQLTTVYKY